MNEKEELISVIIPVYNVEKYLNRCIDSAINQTYKNLEIILVDDGSTDNCGNICDEYAQKDKRIKVIHKKNGGLSDARNVGIEESRGKYITFIDSDDFVEKKFIEVMYKNAKKYNSDISIIGFNKIYENKKKSIIVNSTNEIKEFNSEGAIEELFNENSFNNYAWNKLYNKRIFMNIKFPVGRKMEDLGTTYKTFEKANKIVFQNVGLYNYFIRQGSMTTSQDTKFYFDMYELAKERYQYVNSKYPQMKANKKYFFEICLLFYPFLLSDNKTRNEIQEYLGRYKIRYTNGIKFKRKIEYLFFSISPMLYAKIILLIKEKNK